MSDEKEDSGFVDLKTGRKMSIEEVKSRFAEYEAKADQRGVLYTFMMSIGMVLFGLLLYWLPTPIVPDSLELEGLKTMINAIQATWLAQIVIGSASLLIMTIFLSRRKSK